MARADGWHEGGWRRRGGTNRYPQVSGGRSRNQYRNARLPMAAVRSDVGSRPRTGHGGERCPAARSQNSSDRHWRPPPGSQPRVPADGLSPSFPLKEPHEYRWQDSSVGRAGGKIPLEFVENEAILAVSRLLANRVETVGFCRYQVTSSQKWPDPVNKDAVSSVEELTARKRAQKMVAGPRIELGTRGFSVRLF